MSDFIPNPTPGLVAIYDEGKTYDDGGIKRRLRSAAPIVGYLRDPEKKVLIAAIIGDGGVVVHASSKKGFTGTRWQSDTPTEIESAGHLSVFERMFGRL